MSCKVIKKPESRRAEKLKHVEREDKYDGISPSDVKEAAKTTGVVAAIGAGAVAAFVFRKTILAVCLIGAVAYGAYVLIKESL